METGSLQEIYNQLLADKKVTLRFSTEAEVNSFKVSMYRFKKKQQDQLSDIGFLDEEEVQRLAFDVTKELYLGEDQWHVKVYFKTRLTKKTYSFVVED